VRWLHQSLQSVRAMISRAGYSIYPNTDYFIADQIALLSGKPDPIVFDVGANGGQFARAYRTKLPQARLFCLEPIPHLARGLRQDLPDTEVVELALASSDGLATFHLNEFEDTSSLLAPDLKRMPESYRSAMRPKRSIEVGTVRLDSLMTQYSLEHIDILKMDIQGGEYAALQGAKECLEREQVSIIALEVFFEAFYCDQPRFGDIAALLAQNNYRLHRLYNINFSGRSGRPQWADAIFIGPSVAAVDAAID